MTIIPLSTVRHSLIGLLLLASVSGAHVSAASAHAQDPDINDLPQAIVTIGVALPPADSSLDPSAGASADLDTLIRQAYARVDATDWTHWTPGRGDSVVATKLFERQPPLTESMIAGYVAVLEWMSGRVLSANERLDVRDHLIREWYSVSSTTNWLPRVRRQLAVMAMRSDLDQADPASRGAARSALQARLGLAELPSQAASPQPPKPASPSQAASSRSLDGIYTGSGFAWEPNVITGDWDFVLETTYYLFLSDGRFYFGRPSSGIFTAADYPRALQTDPQNCGTYAIQGDQIALTWGGGRDPDMLAFRFTPDGVEIGGSLFRQGS